MMSLDAQKGCRSQENAEKEDQYNGIEQDPCSDEEEGRVEAANINSHDVLQKCLIRLVC